MATKPKAKPKAKPRTRKPTPAIPNLWKDRPHELAEPIEPRPVGRPTLYKPEYCEQLITHMSNGYSFDAFGGAIGVTRDRVYEWAKKHPEFADAKDVGLARNLMYFEKQGNKGLWEDGEGPKLNNTVWVFSMKNRHGWRDSKDVAITGNVAVNHIKEDLKAKSTDELLEIVKATKK